MHRLKTILYLEWQWVPYFCEIVCPYPVPKERNPLSFSCRESQVFKAHFQLHFQAACLLPALEFLSSFWCFCSWCSPQFRKLFQSSNFSQFSGNRHFKNSNTKAFFLLQSFFSILLKIQEKCYKLKGRIRKENKGTWYKMTYFWAEDSLW